MFPSQLRLDISSVCQLKCPACPTATGEIGRSVIGGGMLRFPDFVSFVEKTNLSSIELSNWGEIFLNPDLTKILQYAFEKKIALTATNGVNLNTARPGDLEALVKYQFRKITCSIDGATQGTYEKYRVKGNLASVIQNIQTINKHKREYSTPYPLLQWQFIAFGHNIHELESAKRLAKELGMSFKVKANFDAWDEKLGAGLSRRKEKYTERKRVDSLAKAMCLQLWTNPQVNWDGTFLGCCMNQWGDFGGNVFSSGLPSVLKGWKLRYAKRMLRGQAAERSEIPCVNCSNYQQMKETGDWVKRSEIARSTLIQNIFQRFYTKFKLDRLHHWIRKTLKNGNSIEVTVPESAENAI